MKKDAYYFSHDANAQDDPKCMRLIDKMGMEGYGIFWAIIERLRAEKEHVLPLSICALFAKRWKTTPKKVESVVKNFSLFILENKNFFSERLLHSMKEKSEKARESANYRWGNAPAMRTHSDGNANGMRNDAIKGKKRKEKERKGNAGKEFDEKKENVFFEDGTSQPLGKTQLLRSKEEDYQPHFIKKGIIE